MVLYSSDEALFWRERVTADIELIILVLTHLLVLMNFPEVIFSHILMLGLGTTVRIWLAIRYHKSVELIFDWRVLIEQSEFCNRFRTQKCDLLLSLSRCTGPKKFVNPVALFVRLLLIYKLKQLLDLLLSLDFGLDDLHDPMLLLVLL